MVENLKTKLSDMRLYWNLPMPGRYMPFKEIAAYAGGGIGAYFIITMGSLLIVSTNNMIVSASIGVSPTHMYILYIISTIANIPLTAIRANMIDNTRNKAGKYRPYLLSMGIPTALISLAYVWFPYDLLYKWFPSVAYTTAEGGEVLMGYIAKCIVVLFFNLLLQFFFNFFNDAYTNLVHVLSPNTQERTDVLSIKSVVYSLAPSIMNFVRPLVAKAVADDNIYDIKVYRILYPAFALVGIALTIVIFGNTKEKIVQARTRTIQVRFSDAFREVAKNKYFWIISLAGWLGFLEGAYANILEWSYNFGHACDGAVYGVITLVTGNASLWGMLLAPLCIRKWGKKKVLVGINLMNVICILAMGINMRSMIWLTICIYINYLFGAFEQITSPAIQADIRDYHQYKTGERIDGMFATVATIGGIVTLITSSVLPMVYESYGIFEGNGYENPYAILDINGNQPELLYEVMGALILMAAVGAFLNVVPYFFYDLTEKQQKGIVRVLKIRAMFEDYGNGVTNNRTLVEAVDIINEARAMAEREATPITKELKQKRGKAFIKELKKANEENDIAKFVCAELVKFTQSPEKEKYEAYYAIYSAGLSGIFNMDPVLVMQELADARKLPKGNADEKALRTFAIDLAKAKLSCCKAVKKYYKSANDFVQPDFTALDLLFNEEDECDAKLRQLYIDNEQAKKEKDSFKRRDISQAIKAVKARKKELQNLIKAEMDKHSYFARAAKVYIDAERVVNQKQNYEHLEELIARYEEAKAQEEADRQAALEEQERLNAEKERLKAEKAAAKKSKKD